MWSMPRIQTMLFHLFGIFNGLICLILQIFRINILILFISRNIFFQFIQHFSWIIKEHHPQCPEQHRIDLINNLCEYRHLYVLKIHLKSIILIHLFPDFFA